MRVLVGSSQEKQEGLRGGQDDIVVLELAALAKKPSDVFELFE
jgi:hypothetical protein